jgi:hypothetical protein
MNSADVRADLAVTAVEDEMNEEDDQVATLRSYDCFICASSGCTRFVATTCGHACSCNAMRHKTAARFTH